MQEIEISTQESRGNQRKCIIRLSLLNYYYYLPSIKDYSQHYEICTLRTEKTEIKYCPFEMKICAFRVIVEKHDQVNSRFVEKRSQKWLIKYV